MGRVRARGSGCVCCVSVQVRGAVVSGCALSDPGRGHPCQLSGSRSRGSRSDKPLAEQQGSSCDGQRDRQIRALCYCCWVRGLHIFNTCTHAIHLRPDHTLPPPRHCPAPALGLELHVWLPRPTPTEQTRTLCLTHPKWTESFVERYGPDWLR